MQSLNNIHLIGHVGQDPNMRYTPNGKATSQFSLAVSDGYMKDGEWKESTEWFNVGTWGRHAEFVNEKYRKGDTVYVSGKLKLRKYTTTDGREGVSLDVNAQTTKLLVSKNKVASQHQTDELTDDPFPIEEPDGIDNL